jgi:hypothetical protein
MFKKATKEKSRLRAALIGPAGSGKTYTALRLACGLAGDAGVAVIDTERGSASKYADIFDFDVAELTTFSPEDYVKAIQEADAAGYGALVIDSLSHAWIGVGGALDQVDKAAAQSQTKNTFGAWRTVTPKHNKMVDAILACKAHVIVTMRAKTEYALEADEKNKYSVRKVGLAPVQRDGLEYEFDVVGDMTIDNTLIISKTRCSALSGAVINKPGEALAKTLLEWLSDGATAPAAPAGATVRPISPGKSLAEQLEEAGIPVNEITLADAAAGWFDPEISLYESYKFQIDEAKTLADLDVVSKNMAKEVPKDHPNYPALVAAGKSRKGVLLDQKAAKES